MTGMQEVGSTVALAMSIGVAFAFVVGFVGKKAKRRAESDPEAMASTEARSSAVVGSGEPDGHSCGEQEAMESARNATAAATEPEPAERLCAAGRDGSIEVWQAMRVLGRKVQRV